MTSRVRRMNHRAQIGVVTSSPIKRNHAGCRSTATARRFAIAAASRRAGARASWAGVQRNTRAGLNA